MPSPLTKRPPRRGTAAPESTCCRPAPLILRAAAHLTPAPDPPRVVAATPADLAYVVHLQKKHGDAIGFVPRQALAEKIDQGRIHLATENSDPAGYLHHGTLTSPTGEVRIFQAAVQYDARRRHLALGLVDDLLTRATAAGARGVSLRCLSYLDANQFWTAAGFDLLATEPGAKGTLNVWGRRIHPIIEDTVNAPRDGANRPFSFHSRLHPCPACGRPTTDTWTRGAIRRRLCAACVAGAQSP